MARRRLIAWGFVVLAFAVVPGAAQAQQGVILNGGGPVSRSMGGVGAANPVDSLSCLFWNPAGLSALPQNEMTFGSEFIWAHPRLFSLLPANTFGRGLPPITLGGESTSESGVMLMPNFGLAHHVEGSDVTLGLGVLSAAGFSANYPASLFNPVLTPQPPNGFGVGRLYAELQVVQVVPTVSLQLTDRLSVGFSPIIDIANLRASPLLVAPPDDANGNGFFTYPDGEQTRWHWGAGFQIGVYYSGCNGWNFGASFKSPQWMDTFRFNTVDELGRPRADSARFDLPWIASVGASYTGFEHWIFAADLRYIDYRNAEGFDDTGFQANGAVRGLGWDSQFVIAAGAQYQLSDRLALRAGYSFNNNPQDASVAFFNVAAPTILEHTVYTGFSYNLSQCLTLSVAYIHAFESSVEGPLTLPVGAIPGTSVRSSVSADAATFGFTVRY
ncbi:MAG: outer membrane protein transport protein [Gemmataceae bacterium]